MQDLFFHHHSHCVILCKARVLLKPLLLVRNVKSLFSVDLHEELVGHSIVQ